MPQPQRDGAFTNGGCYDNSFLSLQRDKKRWFFTDSNRTLPKQFARKIGVVLIVAGIGSVIFNLVAITAMFFGSSVSFYSADSRVLLFSGYGLWSGIMSFVAGSFGLFISKPIKNNSVYILNIYAFLILCFIAACLSVVQCVLAILGMEFHAVRDNCLVNYIGSDYCHAIRLSFAMEVLLGFLALLEGAAAILGALLCCHTFKCCKSLHFRCIERMLTESTETEFPDRRTMQLPDFIKTAEPPSYFSTDARTDPTAFGYNQTLSSAPVSMDETIRYDID